MKHIELSCNAMFRATMAATTDRSMTREKYREFRRFLRGSVVMMRKYMEAQDNTATLEKQKFDMVAYGPGIIFMNQDGVQRIDLNGMIKPESARHNE